MQVKPCGPPPPGVLEVPVAGVSNSRNAGPENQYGGDGLLKWTAANRSLDNRDVVLWYTMRITHNPRPEDWPVMPVHSAGFKLVPWSFFDRNPALDLPPER